MDKLNDPYLHRYTDEYKHKVSCCKAQQEYIGDTPHAFVSNDAEYHQGISNDAQKKSEDIYESSWYNFFERDTRIHVVINTKNIFVILVSKIEKVTAFPFYLWIAHHQCFLWKMLVGSVKYRIFVLIVEYTGQVSSPTSKGKS